MAVLRPVARPMMAAIFVIRGLAALLHPDTTAPAAEKVVRPLAERVPVVPDQVEQAVRLNGAGQVAAGSLLAIGKFPRLSAAALAASLVPTTAAGHRFWESDDKQERAQQQIHFLKNLSMLARPARGQTGQAGGGAGGQERRGRGADGHGPGRSQGGQGGGEDRGPHGKA